MIFADSSVSRFKHKSMITFSYTKYFVHSYTVDVVFTHSKRIRQLLFATVYVISQRQGIIGQF